MYWLTLVVLTLFAMASGVFVNWILDNNDNMRTLKSAEIKSVSKNDDQEAGNSYQKATTASKSSQYIDETGYAVSGYDVVSYFDITQAPLDEMQPAPIPGKAEITTDWNGATFAFATAENRDRFISNPELYAPQYEGHCAYGIAVGHKVPGNPRYWRIIDDKLYLNKNATATTKWGRDIPESISLAETNWNQLRILPASHETVPDLDSTLAPAK